MIVTWAGDHRFGGGGEAKGAQAPSLFFSNNIIIACTKQIRIIIIYNNNIMRKIT